MIDPQVEVQINAEGVNLTPYFSKTLKIIRFWGPKTRKFYFK